MLEASRPLIVEWRLWRPRPGRDKGGALGRGLGTSTTLSDVAHDGVTHPGAFVRADQPWSDAQLAGLYDAFVFDGDLPLYLELAASQVRRVLEVACGSRRVLVAVR